MDEATQRLAARNESLFRETNEAIERGQWPDEPAKLVRFRCECARLECGDAVPLTLGEYEQVRSSPRRFFVVPGHELPEVETVITSNERYAVVEKQAAAGEAAEAKYPRS
jgi:hypothetical protein